ncbi:MAG: hypothetical protein MZW92_26180 [Comamonadaceae bacterium]|nr:hypothetical protein [Comamonadaceae bacterium]
MRRGAGPTLRRVATPRSAAGCGGQGRRGAAPAYAARRSRFLLSWPPPARLSSHVECRTPLQDRDADPPPRPASASRRCWTSWRSRRRRSSATSNTCASRLGAPIEYDRDRQRLPLRRRRTRGQQHELPGLWFDERELYSLLMAHQLLGEPGRGGHCSAATCSRCSTASTRCWAAATADGRGAAASA